MKDPEFTCVIPAYEREKTIARAVESALSQTSPPREVVVVDDGSTDDTVEVTRAIEGPVRVLSRANAGAASARNAGVRASTTEWVAFLDSDDWWDEEHLAFLARAIRATEGQSDLYFSDMAREPGAGPRTQFELCDFRPREPWEFTEDATSWVLRPRIPMMLQACAVRKEAFLAAGGLWPALKRRHDTHLFVRLGVGRPACAVSHVGTVMTADDDAGRLTSVMEPGSEAYSRYSAMLWADLRRRFAREDEAEGGPIRYRLFLARWQLARIRLRRFDPRGMGDLTAAFRVSPPLFAQSLLRRRPMERIHTARTRARA